jgi:hypothetical protein
MQLFVERGKGILLINCGEKLPQGVNKHLQACQKLQCPRAKFVYLLLDMSQVCMTLCVTSIQGWYHDVQHTVSNIIYYPSVITDTGLLCRTYRRLVFAATVLLYYRSEILSTFGESFVYNHGHYFEKNCGTFLLLRHIKRKLS